MCVRFGYEGVCQMVKMSKEQHLLMSACKRGSSGTEVDLVLFSHASCV